LQGLEGKAAAGKLPPILVTAGATDERVPIWMPAKWVAAVREKPGVGGKGEVEVCLNLTAGGHYLTQEEELHLDALEAAFLENLA